jgi:MYXO-CTERM domain-containing protein
MRNRAEIRRVMMGTAVVAALALGAPSAVQAQATTDPNTGAAVQTDDMDDDDGFDMGWLGLIGLAGLLGLRRPAHTTTVPRDTTATGRH